MLHATALIADDEDLPREELKRLLRQLWPTLEIVAECEDGLEAAAAIKRLRPDIAFLDIRMPGLSGLDLAVQAGLVCELVFTTAYDSHALQAFETGALDYLLKPLSADRLAQAVSRLQQRLSDRDAGQQAQQAWSTLRERSGPSPLPQPLRWISASAGDTIKLFSVDELIFLQSDEKYTRVVTARDEAHVRTPLKELALGLDEDRFWRISRGVIVRADAIAAVRRNELGRYLIGLREHPEVLTASAAHAWRFKPM